MKDCYCCYYGWENISGQNKSRIKTYKSKPSMIENRGVSTTNDPPPSAAHISFNTPLSLYRKGGCARESMA